MSRSLVPSPSASNKSSGPSLSGLSLASTEASPLTNFPESVASKMRRGSLGVPPKTTSSRPSPLRSPTARLGPRRFCRIGNSGCCESSSIGISRATNERAADWLTSLNCPMTAGFLLIGCARGVADSVNVNFRSTAKSVNVCVRPLGHSTVTFFNSVSSPSPKCSTGSELDNTPRANTSWRT